MAMRKKNKFLKLIYFLFFLCSCDKRTAAFTYVNENEYVNTNGCRLFFGSEEKEIYLDRIAFFLNEKKDYKTFNISDVSFADVEKIDVENVYYMDFMGKGKNIDVHFMFFNELESYDELINKIKFISEKTDFFSYLGVFYSREGTHLA